MIGKLERPAGLAPAFPDWKSGILLLDDDRFVNMITNTAASPVMDSHPQEDFSADLSVFQAHLAWQIHRTAKPLVDDNSPGRGNRAIQFLQSVMMK